MVPSTPHWLAAHRKSKGKNLTSLCCNAGIAIRDGCGNARLIRHSVRHGAHTAHLQLVKAAVALL